MLPVVLLVLVGTGALAAAAGTQRVSAVVSAAERALGLDLKLPPVTEALVAKWAAIRGIPVNWLRAIVYVESRGVPTRFNVNERAMKLGGAWGLGAMTLVTAKDLIRQGALKGYPQLTTMWVKSPVGKTLLNPDLNLALVSFYIAQLQREFRAFDKVAAAYHSGPGLVRGISAKGVPLTKGLGPMGKLALQMYTDAYVRTAAA